MGDRHDGGDVAQRPDTSLEMKQVGTDIGSSRVIMERRTMNVA
jgi:hypothetical protein